MSDGLSEEAELRLKITNNIAEVAPDLDKLNELGGFGEKVFVDLGKAVNKAGEELGVVGREARGAGTAAGAAADEASAEWKALAKAIGEAEAEYRAFQKEVAVGNAAGSSVSGWMSGAGVSAADLEAYGKGSRANLVGDEAAERRDAARVATETAKAEDRLVQALGRSAQAWERRRKAQDASIKANWDKEFAAQTKSLDENAKAEARLEQATLKRQRAERQYRQADNKRASSDWDAEVKALGGLGLAADEARKKTRGLSEGDLPRLRYALYDVSRTAAVGSAALLAFAGGAAVASAKYESAFTAVERTSGVTGAAVGALRGELVGLTRDIPLAFSNVADLAARGAQLGVASGNLQDFTRTVAEFVATSDTVTLDAAVEAFGRISNLMGDNDFNRIGSAITLVGVNAAATEGQIVKTTQELAPFATAVGMTTDEVIGLASSVASLGQPPERARSAFLTLQRVMDEAVAGMTDNLKGFSTLLGMTEGDVAALWKTNPAQFIRSFSTALGGVENLTIAFEALGIKERRAVQVFQALAADARNAGAGMSVLEQGFEDANQGYVEGTELARQYGLIVDDLASKWQLFVNGLSELAATAGDAAAPALKMLLDVATQMLNTLSDVASTPAAQWFIAISIAAGGVGGALLGLVATIAAVGGSLLALRTAITALGWQSATSGITGLIAGLVGVEGAAMAGSRALTVFKGALAATGIGLAIVLIGTLATAFTQASESAQNAFNTYIGSTGGLADAMAADMAAYRTALAEGQANISESFEILTLRADANTGAIDTNSQAIYNAATILGLAPSAYQTANEAIATNTAALGENTIAWIRNQLMQSEAFLELTKNQDFADYWTTIGASMEEVIRLSATGGQQAVMDYFSALEAQAHASGAKFASAFSAYTESALGVKTFNSSEGTFFGLGGNAQGTGLQSISKILDGVNSQMKILGLTGGGATAKLADGFDDAESSASDFSDSLGGSGGSGGDGVIDKVRTLLDYGSDLSGVMSRAFDLRFGNQQALDKITAGWNAVKKATDEANASIAEIQGKLRLLGADQNIKKFWLTVAEGYGDTLRADKLRAELDEINGQIADSQAKLKQEQDKASKGLDGNSESALNNRGTILDLVSSYQDLIVEYANSGMSQDELGRKVEELKNDFIEQATKMGYGREEVKKYAAAFDDMRIVIEKVPRNVTVTANANPALQALAEFVARTRDSMRQARDAIGGGVSIPVSTVADPSGIADGLRKVRDGYAAQLDAFYKSNGGNQNLYSTRLEQAIGRINAQLSNMGYRKGGYTGNGPVGAAAGIVHGKEFVFNAQATKAIGPDQLYAMQSAAMRGKAFGMASMAYQHPVAHATASAGAGVGGGRSPLELSPFDRQLLMDIRSAIGITFPGAAAQSLVGAANARTSRRKVA